MNIQRICTVACYIWYFHHYNYHLYNLLSQKAVTYDTAFLQKAIWVYVFLHKVTDISTPLSPELIMSTVQFISDLCKIYAFVWKLRFQFYLSEMLETYSVSTLQCLINGGIQIVGGWKKFWNFDKRGGPNKRGVRFGNPYLKIML